MKELSDAQWAVFHELVDELDRLDASERLRRFEAMSATATADPVVIEWVGDWLASPVGSAVATGEAAPLRDVDLPGNRYLLLGRLDRGGMAEVYRARDRELDREVAIKVVRPGLGADDDAVQRFLREARIVAKLEHPGIVPVHEAGRTADGRVYFVMKLVRGTTLAEMVERRDARGAAQPDLPLRRQVEIVLRLCDALTYAHDRGVLHRDLKPENVMVGQFGEVQLMDWGIARVTAAADAPGAAASAASGASTTCEGDVLGTPAYLSPEQARGAVAEIDERTDVFGLGAIAYFLFSGQRPYAGRDRDEVIVRARRGELGDPGFRTSHQSVPRELQAICRKALSYDRGDRYASATALSLDLQAHLDSKPVVALPPGPLVRGWKLLRRRPAVATSLVLVALFSPLLSYGWFELSRATGVKEQLRAIEFHDRVRDAAMVDVVGRPEARDDPMLAKLLVHSAAALTLADLLKEWRIELGGEEPPTAIAARIDELDSSVRADAIVAIYSIAKHLASSGLAHAACLVDDLGQSPEVAAANATMRADHPREVKIWPQLHSILTSLADQSVGAHSLAALQEWLLHRNDTLDVVLERWREAGAEQVNFVAYVVGRIRGNAEAIPILEHAIDVAPGDILNHYQRAVIAVQEVDAPAALRSAAVTVALAPRSISALHLLAAAYDIDAGQRFDRGDEAGADAAVARSIELNRRTVELQPTFVEGWHNLAIALKHGGQFDEAIDALETERKLAPDDWQIDAAMGDAYEQRTGPGDLEKAEACYRRVIAAAPDWWGGHYQLGNLLRHRGETEAAIASYRAALAGGRGTTEAHAELAMTLSLAGRHAEAAEVAIARLESARGASSEEEVRDLVTLAQTCIPVVANRELRASLRSRLAAVSR